MSKSRKNSSTDRAIGAAAEPWDMREKRRGIGERGRKEERRKEKGKNSRRSGACEGRQERREKMRGVMERRGETRRGDEKRDKKEGWGGREVEKWEKRWAEKGTRNMDQWNMNTYVAVLGRNRTLFCRVFWSHYRVQTAAVQYFSYGWGSYVLCKLMNTWYVYTARMSPTLNGSSALQRFERSNAIEISNTIMFDFYPGLPHMYGLSGYVWCKMM